MGTHGRLTPPNSAQRRIFRTTNDWPRSAINMWMSTTHWSILKRSFGSTNSTLRWNRSMMYWLSRRHVLRFFSLRSTHCKSGSVEQELNEGTTRNENRGVADHTALDEKCATNKEENIGWFFHQRQGDWSILPYWHYGSFIDSGARLTIVCAQVLRLLEVVDRDCT